MNTFTSPNFLKFETKCIASILSLGYLFSGYGWPSIILPATWGQEGNHGLTLYRLLKWMTSYWKKYIMKSRLVVIEHKTFREESRLISIILSKNFIHRRFLPPQTNKFSLMIWKIIEKITFYDYEKYLSQKKFQKCCTHSPRRTSTKLFPGTLKLLIIFDVWIIPCSKVLAESNI